MAGTAKTNDTGDDTVTRWIWFDSRKQGDLIQYLIKDNLIEKQDTYNTKTLGYFKVTAKRENMKKIQEAIAKFNTSKIEPFIPNLEDPPKARLAASTPLDAILDDHSVPTVSIQLTYTYGCIDDEELTACDLVSRLEKLRPYKYQLPKLECTVQFIQKPRKFVFKPDLLTNKQPVITVSACCTNFGESQPEPDVPVNNVYCILTDMFPGYDIEKDNNKAKL